jgi:hypothetical protein
MEGDMTDDFYDVIANMYNSDHVGVEKLQDALGSDDLDKIASTFVANTDRFYQLKFGNATRWDLTDEDFQKYPVLELVRKHFKGMTSGTASAVGFNPIYQEKFSVMFYPEGSSGVQPHRDSEHSVNWVVVYVISGDNSFFAAKDAKCKQVKEFPTKPGDVVVMRGPRSADDSLTRPVHYVGEVTKPRYVLICRHINLEKLKT